MDDHDPIAPDAEIAAPRIDHMEAIPLLFSHIANSQLIGIEEFNDPPFKRHAYNSVICRMRCSVRWSARHCESKTKISSMNSWRGPMPPTWCAAHRSRKCSSPS